LYTLILFAACLMPFAYGMSSWVYLVAAVVLSAGFLCLWLWMLWREYSDALARKTFPLFTDPPERAVCGPAGGPLCFVRPDHGPSIRYSIDSSMRRFDGGWRPFDGLFRENGAVPGD
jgi:hypothetical protein